MHMPNSSVKNLQCSKFQRIIILSNSIRNQDTKMSILVEFLSDLALLESTPLDMDGRAMNLILDMKMQLDEFCADYNTLANFVPVLRDGYHIVSTPNFEIFYRRRATNLIRDLE